MEITKEKLYDLYWRQELSTRAIGEILGCSYATINKKMKYFGIRLRNKSEALSGTKNPMYGKAHSEDHKRKISESLVARMTDEERARRSAAFSGPNNPMFGRNHSNDTKILMSESAIERMKDPNNRTILSLATKEQWKNEEYRDNMVKFCKSRIGDKNSFWSKTHSDETREKISKANKGKFVGEKGSNWRGGKTELTHRVRNCSDYILWRSKIFKRDDYTCSSCGARGGKLCVDHIKPFALIWIENKIETYEDALACNELWDHGNGRTLCVRCHKATPSYGWGAYWQKIYLKQQQEFQSSDQD